RRIDFAAQFRIAAQALLKGCALVRRHAIIEIIIDEQIQIFSGFGHSKILSFSNSYLSGSINLCNLSLNKRCARLKRLVTVPSDTFKFSAISSQLKPFTCRKTSVTRYSSPSELI